MEDIQNRMAVEEGYMKVLDVGPGVRKYPGSIGIDRLKLSTVDIVHNIEEIPWPIEDNTFDLVFCSHVLEHVRNLEGVMKEIYRILKPSGVVDITCPHFSNRTAFTDPTHVRFIGFCTFDFFCQGSYSERWSNFVKYYDTDFIMLEQKFHFVRRRPPQRLKFLKLFDPFVNAFPIVYERFFAFIFPSTELIFKLQKPKED